MHTGIFSRTRTTSLLRKEYRGRFLNALQGSIYNPGGHYKPLAEILNRVAEGAQSFHHRQ